MADRELVGYVETNDPYQKIKYFKKLLKFKNKHDLNGNEISFVPHLSESNVNIVNESNSKSFNNENELTTVIIDAGNKFAYDTINNNEISEFDTSSNYGKEDLSQKKISKNVLNEIQSSSTEPTINNINENKEKQKAEIITATNNNSKQQIEKEHIGNKIGVVDDDINIRNDSIETGSTEPSMKNSEKHPSTLNVETQKFISEHLRYTKNNITIKKSWSKWTPWSVCSRSCDDGVMSQSRECMLKM